MFDRNQTRRGIIVAGALLLVAGCMSRAIDAPPASVVFFTNQSTDLDANARGVIAEVVADAKARPMARITVRGFADTSVATPAIATLGQRRADAATEALVAQGVARNRITQVPRGGAQADPGIESRRVDIELAR